MSTRPGRFGDYGGMYAPETLVPLLQEVERAFAAFCADPGAEAELAGLLADYAGRPTPLYRAANLSRELGFTVYLKREDLLHGGAHKTNNCLGQGLLARRMGRRRLIAETGAGQHGFATAMVGALLGLETVIYMGARDIERQRPNVLRMELCGAEVVPVTAGAATLKEAINEAFRDWIATVEDTYYLFGTVAGPHPFPSLVAHFQSVIGRETRAELLHREGRLPRAVVACVGGGSNAIGTFRAFLGDDGVELVGVEPGGEGVDSGRHGATLVAGIPGVFHGSYSYLLADDDGQVQEAHSLSAGLDYPGVGPEHAWLRDSGRARYAVAGDAAALDAFQALCRLEGIIPALEPAHALAYLFEHRAEFAPDDVVVVNLSGRGDKDLDTVRRALGAAEERP